MRAQSRKLKRIDDANMTARSHDDVLEMRNIRGRRREQHRAGKTGTVRLRTVSRRKRKARRRRGNSPCLKRLGTWRGVEVERGGELSPERLELSLLRELNLLSVLQEGAPSLLQNRRFMCALRRRAVLATDAFLGSMARGPWFGSKHWLLDRGGSLSAAAWTFGGALLWSAS